MARTHTSNIIQSMEAGTFFVKNEIPTGAINNTNTTFTLAGTPAPSTTLELTLNGQELKLTDDFTLTGDTIEMVEAPYSGDILKADYLVTPAA